MGRLSVRCRALARPRRPRPAGPPRPSRRPPQDGGFTLVEVMVAMVILTVVALAAFGVLMNALQAARGNADRVQAASIARTELERLRALGASGIPIGLSTPTAYAGTGFTVTSSANWVGVDQDTNPCESALGGSPGQAYMRVHIEVTSPDLGAPQVIDAIVPPADDVPAILAGSATVWVRDQQSTPQPVSGVTVTATSNAVGATTQTAITGYDGCVFFADLVPGNWTVTLSVAPPFMVKPNTSATATLTNLAPGQNVPVSFYYAQSTGITFSAGAPKFPLLTGIPFRGTFGAWSGPVPSTFPVDGFSIPTGAGPLMWPDSSGYTALLGCNDAGSPTLVPVQPGVTSTAKLTTKAVEIVGPAGEVVTVKHASESNSPCSGGLDLPTGALNVPTDPDQPDALPGPLGREKVSLPLGTWRFSVAGEDDKVVTFTDSTPSPCSVYWPAKITPTPTPSPTPTPTSTAPAKVQLPPIEPENPPCSG